LGKPCQPGFLVSTGRLIWLTKLRRKQPNLAQVSIRLRSSESWRRTWCVYIVYVDSDVVLCAASNVITETGARLVPEGVVVVRADHAGTALDHVRCSVYSLSIQRRAVVVEIPLQVLEAVALLLLVPSTLKNRV